MTFNQKSYGGDSKVEKPVVVTMSYNGSDDEEELQMVPAINNNNKNNNNNYNAVSDSESNNKSKENHFDEDINEEIKADLKTTINIKVVHAMKKLQALYDDDANKIVKEAAQEEVLAKI